MTFTENQKMNVQEFTANTANPVFYRTYSRKDNGIRESWGDVCKRTLGGIVELGKLTEEQASLLEKMQTQLKCLPSGRWLWVGGTDWVKKPENYSGAYNCTSTNITDWKSFGLLMDLAMQGSGTGAVLEEKYISQLPKIVNEIDLEVVGEFGSKESRENTLEYRNTSEIFNILVGDSRKGWVKAYLLLLYLSSSEKFLDEKITKVKVDISPVRKSGEKLKGFGGTANPIKLKEMFERVVKILNKAVGRQLTSEECCLIIDSAALAIVAGNIRRSAGMRQMDAKEPLLKTNLWIQDENKNWKIDPERDVLRMANHTRVYHTRPTLGEITEAVKEQFNSGEGAIQFAPEAIARSNADILDTELKRFQFINEYCISPESAGTYLSLLAYGKISKEELEHRLQRYGLNPCGEIIFSNGHCNLAEVHLNQLDPFNWQEQKEAFRAGALSVASLLHHKFVEPRYQESRELDPIVGVSFTGLFDFFVKALGVDWLLWWQAGRPDEWKDINIYSNLTYYSEYISVENCLGLDLVDFDYLSDFFRYAEQEYLTRWREIVHKEVWAYCDAHDLKRPNRCTTVQPAGTKSLLTGASSGWHPPKAARYIRRITFAKNDPVALACIDYGYSVVPSQSDKDETGKLLNDPFDSRCTEWLVEIPVEMSWAVLPGADQIDISQFSALAQFDFYMQVQKYYTTHNTSATIELREHEIEPLANRIYQAIQEDEGYISTALLARFDSKETYPRLPFEPISNEQYCQMVAEVIKRRKTDDFYTALLKHDAESEIELPSSESGPMACDSDKCLMPEFK